MLQLQKGDQSSGRSGTGALIVSKSTANVEKRPSNFAVRRDRISRTASSEILQKTFGASEGQGPARAPNVSAVAQWLHSYVTDHRIYCGFPGRAGVPARPATRVAAVRRLLGVRTHVADAVQAAALARHAPAGKVVGFRVRERVA